MKLQNEKQQLKIPIEIFLDLCKMIRNGNLQNKIIGCNDSMGEVIVELSVIKTNKIQVAALENIFDAVNEWNDERFGEEDPNEIALS